MIILHINDSNLMECNPRNKEMITVLLVEDNASFRQSLKEILSTRFPHLKLAEAADGKEALEKVTALQPSLVFMDIKMPGENGLEITKKIKTSHPHITIVVLTSYDLPEYRHAAYHNGANHFLTKGTSSRSEIVSLVENILH